MVEKVHFFPPFIQTAYVKDKFVVDTCKSKGN